MLETAVGGEHNERLADRPKKHNLSTKFDLTAKPDLANSLFPLQVEPSLAPRGKPQLRRALLRQTQRILTRTPTIKSEVIFCKRHEEHFLRAGAILRGRTTLQQHPVKQVPQIDHPRVQRSERER